jgi:lysophospholipase L1-like esterase
MLLTAAGCARNHKSTAAVLPSGPDSASVTSPKPAAPTPPAAPDLATNPPSGAVVNNPKLPTVFIAGDSTAARGAGESQQGWAVPFADYFNPAKVNVVNLARGGRSSRTFITEGLWDKLLADVKAGDIVLIQFGHNDAGAINDSSRARGSLPGLGEETQEIDNLLTKQHEIVHTFGWYIRKMITDTKAKGATPVVLSLTIRNVWKDGWVEHGSGRYSQWSAEIGKAAGVQFVDVTDIVADKFNTMGEEKVKALYPRDHTHFNAVGADLHAAAVVSGLKGLRSNPVRQFLSAKGAAVEPDLFGPLNLPRPANPSLPSLFLIGDSTVRNGHGDGAGGQWGWGDYAGAYFDAVRINVVNRAVGGLSSRTYLTQGHWNRVLAMLKKGDFVMMQFGHNDNGPLNDDSRARGTIKGIGDESEQIDNLLTKQHEVVHSYGWYLRKFIADARAKGATPIVCSLVPRKTWKDGKIVRSKDSYAGWAEAVASAEDAPFVDLNGIIADRYDELGPQKVEPLFGDPHTHTSAAGAELNAQCVIAGLNALKTNPLAPYLRAANP